MIDTTGNSLSFRQIKNLLLSNSSKSYFKPKDNMELSAGLSEASLLCWSNRRLKKRMQDFFFASAPHFSILITGK